ncbi:MAG: TonB-dependent receptor [Acidobacteria bacterium]|nr:TonB-dependent receptor [Acidobacteriota bacterium]
MSLVRIFVLLLCLSPAFAGAQAPAPRGRLTLTVADPTGGVIPGASVTLAGLDEATKAARIAPVTTTDRGTAVFENLAPGRYAARAEFPGFEIGLLRDFKVNRGDNKQVVVLALKNMSESVTVGMDGQSQGADRASRAFGLTVTDEQIQALSDDPAEMARQIAELAGTDAIIRVDSFEGQQLPPKAQIKSIHVTRDQFAAETEQPGSTFVDVITQPGVGPIRGQVNVSFRDDSMSAKSPFTASKGPEQMRGFGINLAGTIVDQKAGFSLNIGGQSNYSTPNLNVALPTGKSFDVLKTRQPFEALTISATVDYALTRDQTLKFAYSQNQNEQRNQGIGAYDLPERAFSRYNHSYTFRALQAGPIGRRTFLNSRLSFSWPSFGIDSSLEAPTIVVQDAFTSGGAQRAGRVDGRNLNVASDVDYVRGIHSWRTGVQIYGDWYRATLNNNYLGTYYFDSLEAYAAGTPFLYTRSIGDPLLSFFHARIGVYVQDDIRVRKGLTLSPGVRYSYQTRVGDRAAFEPRVGVTWAPFAKGATTIRASAGIFHGWLDPEIWWQTVRSDPQHQRDVIIRDPAYPDPGPADASPVSTTYRLGDYKLNRNYRYSVGVDQRFSPRFGVNVLYNYYNQGQFPRGLNLNPVVGGARVDPSAGNIILTVTDAELRRHEVYVNANYSLATPSPATNRAGFNWRRVAMNGSYAFIRARRNAIGPFDVPASGTLDTEWGPGPGDTPYRVSVGITSTQVKNLSVNLLINAVDGYPYTLRTGSDDNGDGLLNDRPDGVGLWSLRTAKQWTVNGRFTYTLPVRAAAGEGGAPPRYRTSVYVAVNNLTNHANLIGHSGIMTSPFFMQPTSVANPRKVDVGLNMAF